MRRYRAPSRRTYLKSSFLISSRTMSRFGWIASVFSRRERNGVTVEAQGADRRGEVAVSTLAAAQGRAGLGASLLLPNGRRRRRMFLHRVRHRAQPSRGAQSRARTLRIVRSGGPSVFADSDDGLVEDALLVKAEALLLPVERLVHLIAQDLLHKQLRVFAMQRVGTLVRPVRHRCSARCVRPCAARANPSSPARSSAAPRRAAGRDGAPLGHARRRRRVGCATLSRGHARPCSLQGSWGSEGGT